MVKYEVRELWMKVGQPVGFPDRERIVAVLETKHKPLTTDEKILTVLVETTVG